MSETPVPPEDQNSPTFRLYSDSAAFFAGVEFPTDALSVRRLRALFPDRFDRGSIEDGFGGFFEPDCIIDDHNRWVRDRDAAGTAPYVSWLNDLLAAERSVYSFAVLEADGEIGRAATSPDPGKSSWVDEANEVNAKAKATLEAHYQTFKLADGPEAARFLIDRIEAKGRERVEAERTRNR